ncbi:MAG: polysaccharide deacetylase family protein [Megasphaera elsdenii]|uniref:polysaccharide deacetylase family protein n=1 Tax=Megasphaera TaxID=906 RepID=UPI00147668F7|nr:MULTISPECIES: polysaccharide deacetylase family protein [Megasphaera]MCI6301158.1 polysaccharide deacetylase family protein [Megasphaera elsdenii]MCI6924214.1 polysaccharide deacetylase family protein [Megasphaera elsdenii]MCI7216229.1 polysaccharide deacetylase family protein [Megasphaera elsdenii]MDD7157312.1 polysaccharide deacetylase family protein [Megasphaera elsdenii]MDY3270591.1 polysaccharide deacetylase family protein [Megasphaera elsdenii]
MVKKICSWIVGVLLTVLVLLIGVFAFWYFGSTNYHLTGVPVLNYHQVNNKFNTVLTMKPANFDEQMKYLHDNDYHSITLEQFDAYMRGEGDLPDRPVLITFDDGYVDNYEEAYPILKKYNMRGTIFLIINLMDTPGYLTWDQVKEMAADGMEFGSHTISHKPLTSFDRAGVRHELQDSKDIIEKMTGKPCHFIAFPEGKYNDMVMEETRGAGYRYAFTVDTGRDFPWDDPYDLDRVPMFEGPISFKHFRFRLTFSAFSALLWKTHKYFEHIEMTKDLAQHIPQP